MAQEAFISRYEDLEALRVRLEAFRSNQPPRTRLPEELWRAVVEVAARRGVSLVARALRLERKSLRKRMAERVSAEGSNGKALGGSESGPAQFLELLAPAAGVGSSCLLEVESPQGGKLRLEWKGATVSEVSQLVRAFVGQ
jgi:hypothetical protein